MSLLARSLVLDGFKWHLHYQPGEGVPLFFIHGFLDSGASFSELISHFSQPSWAWDARGFGKSDWLSSPAYYHFYDYLYDLHQVLGALDLDKVILVGHSMGGMIASLYTGAFPEQVVALVNLEGWFVPDTAPETLPDRVRLWIKQRDSQLQFSPFSDLVQAADRLRQRDPFLTQTQADFLVGEHAKETSEGILWRHDPLHKTRAPQPFRLDQAQAFWQRITAPTLLVYGEKSCAVASVGWEERVDLFPNAQLECIPQAGHNLHLHQSQKLSEVILSFLSEHPINPL